MKTLRLSLLGKKEECSIDGESTHSKRKLHSFTKSQAPLTPEMFVHENISRQLKKRSLVQPLFLLLILGFGIPDTQERQTRQIFETVFRPAHLLFGTHYRPA